jgi:hypothetical protein
MRPRCADLGPLLASLALGFLGCTEGAPPAPPSAPEAATQNAQPDGAVVGAQEGQGIDATMSGPDEAQAPAIDAPGSAPADVQAAVADVDVADAAGAMSDANPDAATQADVGCAGLFCEDFEQGSIDPSKWDTQTGAGGTLDVEKQVVAHGQYALHVHGLAGPADYALIVTKNAPAALGAANFGRANFFITPKPLTSGHTQMVFAGTNGTGPAEGPGPFPKLRYMEVANINGGWQIGFDLLDLSPLVEEVAYPAGSPQVPVTTWTCLEWQFTDQPDVVNLWVDGVAIGTFDNEHVSYPGGHTPGTPLYNGTSSGLIGSYTLFGFGFHDWHPNKPFDLYYDDIVLDTKRVGCLPANL